MSKPHDLGYKELFSHPEFVQQLMQGFVPSEISSLLDYSTLKMHPGNYITPQFKEKIEDVVWSIQFLSEHSKKQQELYLFLLIEFQSADDKTMPLRMLHYAASFYHQLIKEKKLNLSVDKLPPVFPIVLYNGDSVWKTPTSMARLISTVPSFIKKYQPQMHYYLLDEKRIEQQQLQASPLPLGVVFNIEQAADLQGLQDAVARLNQMIRTHPNAERVNKVLTHWVAHYLRNSKITINLDSVRSLEDVSMNLAQGLERERQAWKQEGIEKGIREGIEKGLEQGLEQGALQAKADAVFELYQLGVLTPEQISKALHLSLEKVEAIIAQKSTKQ